MWEILMLEKNVSLFIWNVEVTKYLVFLLTKWSNFTFEVSTSWLPWINAAVNIFMQVSVWMCVHFCNLEERKTLTIK